MFQVYRVRAISEGEIRKGPNIELGFQRHHVRNALMKDLHILVDRVSDIARPHRLNRRINIPTETRTSDDFA